jgi:hypothetical protein
MRKKELEKIIKVTNKLLDENLREGLKEFPEDKKFTPLTAEEYETIAPFLWFHKKCTFSIGEISLETDSWHCAQFTVKDYYDDGTILVSISERDLDALCEFIEQIAFMESFGGRGIKLEDYIKNSEVGKLRENPKKED